MARLDDVSQREAVELARQQIEEGGDVLAVELAAGGQHPQDRPELGPKRRQALGKKGADPFAGVRELGPRHAEARALDRELESVGDGVGPGRPALGALAAVEGGIDLDRRRMRARHIRARATGRGRPDKNSRATAGRSSRRYRCGSGLRSHRHQRSDGYWAPAAGAAVAGPGVMKSSTAFQLPSSCFLNTVR